MNSTKENFEIVSKIAELANEWVEYVDNYGNECAYTDCLIEKIQDEAGKL